MTERLYDPTNIEAKWRAWWDETGANAIDVAKAKNPYYILMMFPYPSAEGLHVGNVFAFTGADIQGRYRRLRGFDVFEPIGFDAFGMHSEMFAQKIGRHPGELIPSNIRNFTHQLKMMGFQYDWRHQVDTTSPEYYRWTQWIFLQLYKAGFLYRDVKEVNYAPSIGSVISDEQVNADGTFERDGSPVERRKLPCWFFKITAFADRLLDNHDWLDWSETTRTAQRNWIGRSSGAEVDFAVEGRNETITVFTTRPDTLFGATFMVLAPDHPLVEHITRHDKQIEVANYRAAAAAKKAAPADDAKEKTGVFTGAFAINPVNGERIPIFIADYVMMGYGTGAIMAVPAHDERDFAFAKKYGAAITAVVDPDVNELANWRPADAIPGEQPDPEAMRDDILRGELCWSGGGRAINSANAEVSINGLPVDDAKATITRWLEGKKLGHYKAQYRLRDWGISRQRYWGPPIPMMYDEAGNMYPVPEDQLPVRLPQMKDLTSPGDGRGPLAKDAQWVACTLPDGRPGRRDTDVMDNFLDSAWYFLRYPSATDDKQAWDPALISKWLPVDLYIGGNEHAVLHLLYTRFLCMALSDAGVLKMGERPGMKDRAEPFQKFRAHGLLVKEGAKMSKSKGNVINPDEFVREHGADTLRGYLMFLGPYTQGGDFRDKDIQGVRRFLNRTHAYYFTDALQTVADEAMPREVRVKLHQTIKKVGDDMEALSYNTAIAALMELLNTLKACPTTSAFTRQAFCLLLAPFAPHLCEEIWHEALGHSGSVMAGAWPAFDPALLQLDEMEVPVQINGKTRDVVKVPQGAGNDVIEAAGRACDAMVKQLAGGANVVKVIVVPGGKLVNFIVK